MQHKQPHLWGKILSPIFLSWWCYQDVDHPWKRCTYGKTWPKSSIQNGPSMQFHNTYYINTCHPFGLCSAPYLFNQFPKALQWILENKYGLHWLIHYLDDYFLAGPPHSCTCQEHLNCLLRVCKYLGIPVAMDKVEGPLTVLILLGLELDSTLQKIWLPQDKLMQLLQELQQ